MTETKVKSTNISKQNKSSYLDSYVDNVLSLRFYRFKSA